MSDPAAVRKSERPNKGIPHASLIMEGNRQNDAAKTGTPKNTSPGHTTSVTPKQPDVAKQILEIQREFQRQMTSLQHLIISNNNQTKPTITELRQELQNVAKQYHMLRKTPHLLRRMT